MVAGRQKGCGELSDSPRQKGLEHLALVCIGCNGRIRYRIGYHRSLLPREGPIIAPAPNVVLAQGQGL